MLHKLLLVLLISWLNTQLKAQKETLDLVSVRNCQWLEEQEKLFCLLARLDVFLTQLYVPPSAQYVACVNSKLSNTEAFKVQVLQQLRNLQVLDLSYNDIRQLPTNFLEYNQKITKVILRNNKVFYIPPKMFQFSKKLTFIDFSNNQIQSLQSSTFKQNTELATLHLWQNRITSLPDELFRKNRKLLIVDLSWNNFLFLPETLFKNAWALRKLNLMKNVIKCLARTTFHGNPSLKEINLGYNDIQILPNGIFSKNLALEKILLWGNNITCIPMEIFKSNLNLRYANFMLRNPNLPWHLRQRFSASAAYPNIQHLRKRLLSLGNDSCSMSECIWDPDSATFDCSFRNLRTVQSLLNTCERPRHLKLNGNMLCSIEELEPLTEHFPELRTLDLQNNHFSGKLVSKMFSNAEYLAYLDISSNTITEIPEDLFQSNTLLQRVNLKRNKIRYLPKAMFNKNVHIKQVDVSMNDIDGITNGLFENNAMLELVKFSHNRIAEVKEDMFINNKKLKLIDLSFNRVEGNFSFSTLDKAKNLEMLSMEGNRITDIVVNFTSDTAIPRSNSFKEVKLSNNQIRNIPHALLRARPSTRIIRLDQNDITSVSEDSFAYSPLLGIVDLSYNKISNIPERAFAANQLLQELVLDGNMLTYLPPLLLATNRALRTFSATGNKLKSIPENFFWRNPHLQEVRLADNQIGEAGIPRGLFKYNPILQVVSLSGNLLKILPKFLFERTTLISHVYLDKNDLQNISPEHFETKLSVMADQEQINTGRIGISKDSKNSDILPQTLYNYWNGTRNDSSGLKDTINKFLTKLMTINLRGNPSLRPTDLDDFFFGEENIQRLLRILKAKK